MLQKAFVPYGGYYSSPFSRWQGTLANENAITLGATTAKRWLEEKRWDPKIFDYVFLGITVHQPHGFYGGPWAAALMGATRNGSSAIFQTGAPAVSRYSPAVMERLNAALAGVEQIVAVFARDLGGDGLQSRHEEHHIDTTQILLLGIVREGAAFDEHGAGPPFLNEIAEGPGVERVIILGRATG